MSMRLLLPAVTAIVLTVIAAISLARGAEATADKLVVTQAWARATPPGATVGAAYVTMENRGAAEDRLLGATSPVAQSVTIHETVKQHGVARMRPLESPVISAGEGLEMKPGGTHLMVMGLSAPLREGDSLPLTLTFERAGEITIEAIVAPIGADSPMDGRDHAM